MSLLSNVRVVAEGLGFTEGPVAVPEGLVVCSMRQGAVYRLESDHVTRIATGGGPNGMVAGLDGSLYVAQNGGAWGGDAAEPGIQLIYDRGVDYITTGLSAPNDICFGPDRRLYFTDPGRGGRPTDANRGTRGRLYSCAIDGSDLLLLHEGLKFINGLAFNSTGTALYLADTATAVIYRALCTDGELSPPQPLTSLPRGAPDGMAVDEAGRLWVAATSADALFVFDTEGGLVGAVELAPGSFPTNLCFAGADMMELVVTCGRSGQVVAGASVVAGLPLFAA